MNKNNNRMTFYDFAKNEMQNLIDIYLQLNEKTNNFTDFVSTYIGTIEEKEIILKGFGSSLKPDIATSEEICEEIIRLSAYKFDIEESITFGVYRKIRPYAKDMLEILEKETNGYNDFNNEFIYENPNFLPLFQHLAGIFSKSKLKDKVGSVSDTNISRPAAERLSNLLTEKVNPSDIRNGEILQRLEATLEGIVRDLVGRLLLESIVDHALKNKNIKYKREKDYSSLSGVVYDFRADFVIPNEIEPKVFIEVRKSSTRHASLYAKDKMFSAINWKGQNKELLGILVVDGPWTNQTLKKMAQVFDYVIPISNVNKMAETIAQYIEGDKSKLKWLIHFKVEKNII